MTHTPQHLHNEEQLQEKRQAIQKAADAFAFRRSHGMLVPAEVLYLEIENLYALVRDLKQG